MGEGWREIGEVMQRKPMRTALTMLGVFWGMFMLLLMLGMGNGIQGAVQRTMGNFATNSVVLWGRSTTLPYAGFPVDRRIRLDNTDVAAVAARVDGIATLAPRNQIGGYRGTTDVVHGANSGGFSVMGDVPGYANIQPFLIEEGRFLNALDQAEGRKVAVIGRQVVDDLFEENEAVVGSTIKAAGVAFQVVGTFRSSREGDGADREEAAVHIPHSTWQKAFRGGEMVHWLAVQAHPHVDGAQLEEDVRATIYENKGIHPDDQQALGSFNAREEFDRMQNLFRGIEGFVWFVGIATLLTGVVGVSNIMLIVVRERTAEIGIRRAVGATQRSIVAMVLRESVVVTATAGAAGFVFGVAFLEAVSVLLGETNEVLSNPTIDARVGIVAVLALVVAGVLSGLLPALRAAAIVPVEALRGE